MNILYHNIVCPFSKQARILLKELNIDFHLKQDISLLKEKYSLIKLNIARTLPIFEDDINKYYIIGIYSLAEYLKEEYENFTLFSNKINHNCEIRRIFQWFNEKFNREVTQIYLKAKLINNSENYLNNYPNIKLLNLSLDNLKKHLDYINYLLDIRSFIAWENISIADIAAASHLSLLDYFGEIKWNDLPRLQQWYSIIKSRPSFQQILNDKIAGFKASPNYSNLDF